MVELTSGEATEQSARAQRAQQQTEREHRRAHTYMRRSPHWCRSPLVCCPPKLAVSPPLAWQATGASYPSGRAPCAPPDGVSCAQSHDSAGSTLGTSWPLVPTVSPRPFLASVLGACSHLSRGPQRCRPLLLSIRSSDLGAPRCRRSTYANWCHRRVFIADGEAALRDLQASRGLECFQM